MEWRIFEKYNFSFYILSRTK